MLELKNAKTPEERKIAQEKIDAATSKLEQAKKTKKLAEKKVEEASKTVEQKEQNKQNIEEKLAAIEENENKPTQNTSSKKSASNSNVNNNKTTTKQKEEEEQGSKYDLSNYPDILNKINEETKRQEKEIRKEAEKKTVEFHFYSTNKTLPIRCTESFCGDSGHIWFIEVECDLNKCEGFTDSRTGSKVGTLLIARRADITSITLTAPAAKYGYKFMGWELISSRKAVSNELGEGVLSGKYIATYEKA